MREINMSKINQYNIGEQVFVYNVGMQSPLVSEFVIAGIISNDEGLFYSHDRSQWIKEDYLYKTRKDAYKSLITRAETEMKQPQNLP